MTLPRMSRRLFLLVSVLIFLIEIAGVFLIIDLVLGWQTTWHLEHSAARGDASLWVLALFAVMLVARIVAAMLRLKDAGVSVWFALAYGVPLLLVGFFDAMVFALVTPEAEFFTPAIFRIATFVSWLAILLVPAAGHGFWRAGPRGRAVPADPAGPGGLPVDAPHTPSRSAVPDRRQPIMTGRPARAFGKRGS